MDIETISHFVRFVAVPHLIFYFYNSKIFYWAIFKAKGTKN